MKKKIVIGSIFVVLILMLIPTTSAVTKPVQPDCQKQNKIMGLEELIEIIFKIIEEKPETKNVFLEKLSIKNIEGYDENTVKEELFKQLKTNNSLALAWSLVLYYRAARLGISYMFVQPTVLNYIKTPFLRKLAVIRTGCWGLKLARWYLLGTILGVNVPDYSLPISFSKDSQNKTLTVTHISPLVKVEWEDINQTGSGTCDPLPTGDVEIGDQITNCTGPIILYYLPTGTKIGSWSFPE